MQTAFVAACGLGLLLLYVSLRLILRPKHIDFDAMDGSTFERFCAELLKKNGYRKVRLTEATSDHGIDILADKDGVRYAIQCKCYEGKVGKADRAVVLINNYFTPQAEEDAEALGVLLWDREALLYLMRHGG